MPNREYIQLNMNKSLKKASLLMYCEMLKKRAGKFPKLDVAGSNPVSRPIFLGMRLVL